MDAAGIVEFDGLMDAGYSWSCAWVLFRWFIATFQVVIARNDTSNPATTSDWVFSSRLSESRMGICTILAA